MYSQISVVVVVVVWSLSCVRFFRTPWAVACQAPLPMGFSRQEYWSGLPFPSLGDLPNPGIEPRSPLQADSLSTEPPGKPKEFVIYVENTYISAEDTKIRHSQSSWGSSFND